MRRLRAAFLIVAVVALAARPGVAGPPRDCQDGYCNGFKIFCDGFCHEHGGTQLCNYNIGSGCTDLCVCNDDEMFAGASGYCPPCID